MVRKEMTTPVLALYELDEADVQAAIDTFGNEEEAAGHHYIKAWDLLVPLSSFTHIKHDDWHGSMHLTNTSGLVIRISSTGEEATIGLVY